MSDPLSILVISNNYPSRQQPNYGAFVYNLMQELGKKHNITIISTYKIHHIFKKKQLTYGKENCEVYRPRYMSFSSKNIVGFNTSRLSDYTSKRAVMRVVNKKPQLFDIIYSHFLLNAMPIVDYAKDNNIPVVIASGESTYTVWKDAPNYLKRIKEAVNHIICVSKENKQQLINLGFDPDMLTVVPNAVDYDTFRPLNKIECKQKLKINPDKFVVGFIGHFTHRKGPNRIITAIKSLNDDGIQLVCVGGKGNLMPNEFTKTIGPVPNYQLPEFYNAFDIFVLPTLYEGHCNAIEEAKACGIPIISSKGTSVEEQIDESIGILIDPLNINDIAQAINCLKENKEHYSTLQKNLINLRGVNSLQNRALRINEILLKVLQQN